MKPYFKLIEVEIGTSRYLVPEHMVAWERLRLSEEELLPGDAIPFSGDGHWHEFVRIDGDELHYVYCDPSGLRREETEPYWAWQVWYVLRPPAAPVSMVTIDAVIPVPRRWNGHCKCGAETYTSCFSVEHDGPCGLKG